MLAFLEPIIALLRPLFGELVHELLKHFSGPDAVVAVDPKAVLDRVGPPVDARDLARRYGGLLDVPRAD